MTMQTSLDTFPLLVFLTDYDYSLENMQAPHHANIYIYIYFCKENRTKFWLRYRQPEGPVYIHLRFFFGLVKIFVDYCFCIKTYMFCTIIFSCNALLGSVPSWDGHKQAAFGHSHQCPFPVSSDFGQVPPSARPWPGAPTLPRLSGTFEKIETTVDWQTFTGTWKQILYAGPLDIWNYLNNEGSSIDDSDSIIGSVDKSDCTG